MTIHEVNERLFFLADEKNAKRAKSITPCAKPMLGARVPALRRLAKQIAKEGWREFLERCPDDYFEQQMLQAFVLGYAKGGIEEILSYADRFVPKIRDWAVNDGFCQTFSIARSHRERVWNWLLPYRNRQEEFCQRMAAVMLLSHFLTDEYIRPVLSAMNELSFDAYYTKMGVAWCVAAAYVKYPQETYGFLQDNCLLDWTCHKALQKITESLSVSDKDKEMIRAMKRNRSNSEAERLN